MVDTPRGPASSMTALTPSQFYQNLNVRYGASQGINRGTGADWFGPLNPMAPSAPPQVAGRAFNLPAGYNLNMTPRSYELVTFQTMRALADSYDLLRLVIETRKDQLVKMRWKIRVKGDSNPNTKDLTTPEAQARIDVLTSFFDRPDGVNKWRPWLRSVLEDKFVVDAVTLYKRRNRGGMLIGLEQIDGSTIKVVLDDWARTPQPYFDGGQIIYPPAYQQVLQGVPAVNYSVRDILYRPYNKRVQKAYGYSEVEQIITTVNIAMRRQQFQLGYYTEGNVPEALIGTPESWTPDQVAAFQTYWDALFTGNLAQRRHAKFVPGGVGKTFVPTKEPELKGAMDDWLSRIVCFAFSLSPQSLVTMMNRATAETADSQAKEEGVEPLKDFVKEIIDDVIEGDFGCEDLEFAWDDDVVVDEAKQTEIVIKKVQGGLITVNRGRELIGEEPSPDPGAEVLLTSVTLSPIGANTVEGKKEAIEAGIVADPLADPFGGAGGGLPFGKPKPKPGDKEGEGPPDKKPPPADPEKFAKAARLSARANVQKVFKAEGGVTPVPFDFPVSARCERRIARLLARAFKVVAASVASDVRRAELTKAAKSPEDIAKEADLSAIDDVIEDIADLLGESADAVSREVLARIGVNNRNELVNVVNQRAVDQARQIAADMVGRRWNEDGELVEAVREGWRIDESTRDMIRETIAKGLEDNIGNEAIADAIEESTGFSSERARLIAHTEIAAVNSMASLTSYQEARDDLGLEIKKEWLLGENPCETCLANNAQGAIDLDDDFESGDATPPAHPNCECAVSPVLVDPD